MNKQQSLSQYFTQLSELSHPLVDQALIAVPELKDQPFIKYLQGDKPGTDPDFRAVSTGVATEAAPELTLHILAGKVEAGMKLRQLPQGYEAVVTDLDELANGNIRVELDTPVSQAAGQIWMTADRPATVGHQVAATLLWLSSSPLLPGRTYKLISQTGSCEATVTGIKYQSDRQADHKLAAKTLRQFQSGVCNLSLANDLVFDPVEEIQSTGSFLITNESGKVLGVGGFNFALRRSDNITMQRLDVNKEARSGLKNQKPCVVWLTGLSGAGKSTVANIFEQKLHAAGHHTYLLDGDNVRHGLNKDLGFTDEDRVENIRRISEVARLMVDAGLIVITAFISPFRAERKMARDIFAKDEFIEVFVNTPLEVAEQRDVKGLYKKARSGKLKNFTGIDSPYEPPLAAECEVRTDLMSADEAADVLIKELIDLGKLQS